MVYKNKYNINDRVKCINVTENNFEGLELGKYYTVVGITPTDDVGVLYSVVGESDKIIHHTIDRFDFCRINDGRNVASLYINDKPIADATIKNDKINHPKHYTQYRCEVLDIIEDATKELSGGKAVCLGNVIKYVLRYQFKNGVEDLEKAKFYLEKLISYYNENGSVK